MEQDQRIVAEAIDRKTDADIMAIVAIEADLRDGERRVVTLA